MLKIRVLRASLTFKDVLQAFEHEQHALFTKGSWGPHPDEIPQYIFLVPSVNSAILPMYAPYEIMKQTIGIRAGTKTNGFAISGDDVFDNDWMQFIFIEIPEPQPDMPYQGD